MADGRKKDIITPPVKFNRLIFAYQSSLFIGWTYGSEKFYASYFRIETKGCLYIKIFLQLLTKEFKLNSITPTSGPIHAAVYNENIGEIVSVGGGALTVSLTFNIPLCIISTMTTDLRNFFFRVGCSDMVVDTCFPGKFQLMV
jgi:hypothetical protein